MARRGSKPGERRGGRTKGTANKKTREIADKAAQSGVTPLEVMIEAMRHHYELSQDENLKGDKSENLKAAAAMAEKAAPYIHPRLSAIAHGNQDNKPLKFAFSWLPTPSE